MRMLFRLMRGRALWTILGVAAAAYLVRQRNDRGRGVGVQQFIEGNGSGRAPAWDMALRAGRAAIDGARRLVLR